MFHYILRTAKSSLIGLCLFSIASMGLAQQLTSLSPSSVAAGGPDFVLTANGSGFVAGSAILWNGLSFPTDIVSSTQLTATIPASYIAAQGSASISVQIPGGSISNVLNFNIGQQTSGLPSITALSPGSATPGGPAFTLTILGTNFAAGATVLWNSSALSTTFVSASQLTAFVPAGLIASQGSAVVAVLNPGSITSNSVSFLINQVTSGAPSISAISPNAATQGGPAFTLTVFGSNFTFGALLVWNGSVITTSFVSSSQLTAIIPTGLIASQGSASVGVQNPNGTLSNILIFTINQQTTGAPTISALSPSSGSQGGPAFTLTVLGTNFVSGSSVQWNGSSLTTTFQGSSTQLTASVPASLIANSSTANVRVVNPNGLVSNTMAFSVAAPNSWRIAQIADGSSWKTLFQVINLDQVPVNYSFQFWDDNGNLLQLPFLNGQPGTFAGSLGVGGTAFAETPGTAVSLTQGWANVTSSGRIGVLAIFRQSVPGRPDSEGTASGTQSGSRVFLPFNNTNGFVTGVAIANSNSTQTLSISLTFQADNGTTTTGSLSLPPNAHMAFALTAMFPGLAGQRGSVALTAPTPDIVVTGLRFSPTNSFTSLASFQ
jgi:hypothetical protein